MTEERIPPTQSAPQGASMPATDWREAGCAAGCRCRYLGGMSSSSSPVFRIVSYTAAGLPTMRFEPVESESRPPVWRRGDYWAGVAAGVGIGVLAVMALRLLGIG